MAFVSTAPELGREALFDTVSISGSEALEDYFLNRAFYSNFVRLSFLTALPFVLLAYSP